jgi:hypothetical protein
MRSAICFKFYVVSEIRANFISCRDRKISFLRKVKHCTHDFVTCCLTCSSGLFHPTLLEGNNNMVTTCALLEHINSPQKAALLNQKCISVDDLLERRQKPPPSAAGISMLGAGAKKKRENPTPSSQSGRDKKIHRERRQVSEGEWCVCAASLNTCADPRGIISLTRRFHRAGRCEYEKNIIQRA